LQPVWSSSISKMRGLAQPGQRFGNHPIDRSITLERFEIRKPPTLMTLVTLIINSGFAFEPSAALEAGDNRHGPM